QGNIVGGGQIQQIPEIAHGGQCVPVVRIGFLPVARFQPTVLFISRDCALKGSLYFVETNHTVVANFRCNAFKVQKFLVILDVVQQFFADKQFEFVRM